MTPTTGMPQQRSPELLAVAKRMVWFKPPVVTLADDVFFLNFLMVLRHCRGCHGGTAVL